MIIVVSHLLKLSSPIALDDDGNPRTFYHGTDAKFDKFEQKPGKRYVLFSEFDVNSPGHFFAEDPEFASEFGRNVMPRNLDISRFLLDPNEYPHMGVDSFPEEFEEELRYILAPMIQEKDGYQFIEVGVGAFPIKDESWIYHLIGRNGLMWDALDNAGVVARMKERGYDATYVEEGNGKRGVFVVDSNQIYPVGK